MGSEIPLADENGDRDAAMAAAADGAAPAAFLDRSCGWDCGEPGTTRLVATTGDEDALVVNTAAPGLRMTAPRPGPQLTGDLNNSLWLWEDLIGRRLSRRCVVGDGRELKFSGLMRVGTRL